MKKLSKLAMRLLAHIRADAIFLPGERVAAAVSGGADSVALLCLLLELRPELGIVLSVAHFEHRIRGKASQADARFVGALAKEHALPFYSGGGDAPEHARRTKLTLEAAARELRYEFFASLPARFAVDKIATAHTLDDQAETVLMRLLRGAGTRGLAAILPQLSLATAKNRVPHPERGLRRVGDEGTAVIVRPLLGIRRREIEAYLHSLRQKWREDRSNRNLAHTRNRVRRKLLPLVEREFNPQAARQLAETAEIARAEDEYFRETVEAILPQIFGRERNALDCAALLELPIALQRRILALAAEQSVGTLDFFHLEELRRLAQQKATLEPRHLSLPAGAQAALQLHGRIAKLLLEPARAKSKRRGA